MRKALKAMMFAAFALASAEPSGAVQTAAPAPAPIPPAAAVAVLPPPAVAANPANKLRLELSNGGAVVIQLRPDAAPTHVQRIQTLVRRGFYNGVVFHRVIPGFMAQGGDPKGTGAGGSELPDLKAEFTTIPYMRGIVAAARTEDPNSANSQFFIMFSPNVGLWGKYTVLGRVISGMDAVDRIAVGEPPENPTRIVRATLGDMPVVQALAPAAPAPAPIAPSPAEAPPTAD
ncbi:peptidylprolyl isomerase [Sphingomonas sp.]|uniref:peptidylprolyl isomerase n=1 Tax=Sphingomonas sp. TaxID=28214 RepID=UPI0025E916C2|nr:peptidylprolyl isomerase [Sphingomonas sp.]